jgi:hypothetical protein
MSKLETLLFFHPMPPDPAARLATIGLKLLEDGKFNLEIKREIENHAIDGLLPGHWSQEQKIWFINPDIWACVHNLLVNLGCGPDRNNDPQWILYKVKGSTRELACSQHHSETIVWHLLTTERNLKAWEEKVRAVELLSMSENEETKHETEAWVRSEREQIEKQYAELDALKDEFLDIASKAHSTGEDWLDSIEEKIDQFYKRFDGER